MKRYFLISLSLLTLTACGSKAGGGSDSDSVAADSISESQHVSALPDTAYASAKDVVYDITVADEGINPHINSLQSLYSKSHGVFTFRKDAYRNADFNSKIDFVPTAIEQVWEFITDSDMRVTDFGVWQGGTGWTGQPLLVEWPDSCQKRLKGAGVVNENFDGREVIVGSLASRLYFINPTTGKPTRTAVNVGNPIKGTPSVDPTLNGNIYVGQGVPNESRFGAMVVDLYSNQITDFTDRDPRAWRSWGAYDSSAIRLGQFLFRPGENGTLYKFLVAPGKLTLQSFMRYKVNGKAPGMESSMSIYANYGFVADNSGNLLAVNLETMRPVWLYKMGDDTDASPVICVEDDTPYIYIGCEIDKTQGPAKFVKLNALTGQEVWVTNTEGRRKEVGTKHFDGGFYATALPGAADAKDLVFVNCVENTNGSNGALLAMDRKSGKIVWRTPLKIYSWSSPVGFTDTNNKMWIFTADTAGNVYLVDAKSGKIIYTAHVGNNFESSPAVDGRNIFIGSRGHSIYGLRLK